MTTDSAGSFIEEPHFHRNSASLRETKVKKKRKAS